MVLRAGDHHGVHKDGVLARRDDGMGTAICNRIVAFARVVGAINRNATDFLVLRDLVEKVG